MEKYCGDCKLFVNEEKPKHINTLASNVFFNEDDTQKKLSGFALVIGLAMSTPYGKRHCSAGGTSMAAGTCKVPNEYTPEEKA